MLTTHYVPGAPNWLDLGAPDVDAAAAYYAAVFGWTFQSAGPRAAATASSSATARRWPRSAR